MGGRARARPREQERAPLPAHGPRRPRPAGRERADEARADELTRDEERLARAHAAELTAAGLDARADGGGVHWHVDVGSGARTLRVHCFWYDRAVVAMMLAMNPANQRRRARPAPEPYGGPEYLVKLLEGGARVADGRSREPAPVIAAARAWLAGGALDDVVAAAPFVDERPRAMRAIAATLPPGLRHEIDVDATDDLWIYGEGRACKVAGTTCSFLLGQAQVAVATDSDVAAAAQAWLIDRVAITALDADLEPHAELLEIDPARWHWAHVRDRLANPGDVLAPLAPLILRLADHPIASTFYSYSSLNRFCFSASSHYPWVDDGLPVLCPGDGDDVVERVVASLAASLVRPFFGSAPHHELPLLAEALRRHGSPLVPELIQRRGWYELVVHDATGARIERSRFTTLDELARYCAG